MNNNNSHEEKVSLDAVYAELNAEGRRFRDLEGSTMTWTSTALLGFCGIISFFGGSINLNLKISLTIVITLFSFLSISTLWYGGWRYRQIRKMINEIESPQQVVLYEKHIKGETAWLVPRYAQLVGLILLMLIAIRIVWAR